jgi:t-SNARE complex subunit (syntaxin)
MAYAIYGPKGDKITTVIIIIIIIIIIMHVSCDNVLLVYRTATD